MTQARVIHYTNQFFAGVGGEDKADVPVNTREGVIGPGIRLQNLLGDSAKIVATVYCGDNYFSEHYDEVLASILLIAKEHDAKIVVAGPAFQAGRYGFACVEVCSYLATHDDLCCVTAMHAENPGIGTYKKYKNKKVFLFPTTAEVTGMEDALSKMAPFISKLAMGITIGPAAEEGYIPRGIRVQEATSKSGAQRAIDMMVAKLTGLPFTTEVPLEVAEKVPVAPRITNLKDACLALATTGGVVPAGNPDQFKVVRNTRWGKYPIDKLESMKDAKWDILHGGYNTRFMYDDANYGVPLDVCRELQREGAFGKLYPYYYSSPGHQAWISALKNMGRGMVLDMKAEGVDGALLVSTWGSCTRSGAVIAKEFEKEGLPVAIITAMTLLAEQNAANRVITGVKIPHPCGDPNQPPEVDRAVRTEIVKCALTALQTDVDGPTIFTPDVKIVLG